MTRWKFLKGRDTIFPLPGAPALACPSGASVRSLAAVLSGLFLFAVSVRTPAAQQQTQPPTPILTTANEVRNLSPARAAHAIAHLQGTVSYYDRGEHNLFLQDATGGVYVDTDHSLPIAYGDLISVDGPTAPSFRSIVALNPVIRLQGKGKLLPPHPVTYSQLATGDEDSQLVTLHGTVRAINLEQHETAPIIHLDVQMPGGEVEIYQPVSAARDADGASITGVDNSSLLDAEVEITGVAGGAFDSKSQLTGIIVYVQYASGIRVLKPASADPLTLPLTDVDNLFRSRQVQDQSQRVRVRGTLTFYRGGDSAVLEQPDGKSVFVQIRETTPLAIGDIVDAIGFASFQEYAPSLRQAELFSTGKHSTIPPHQTSFSEAMDGIYSDNLVAMEGILVSEVHAAAGESVVINVENHPVTGRLAHAGSLPDLRIGSRVRLVGICRIVPGGPYRAPIFFHLEMRSPADFQRISAPSWFTVRHLFASLGALSLLVLAIAGWAMLLRRRVKQQTQRIERSMLIAKRRSALLETISSSQSLPQVITLICHCTAELLPGVVCTWLEAPAAGDPPSTSPELSILTSGVLHEVDLPGVGEAQAGRLVFQGLSAEPQSVSSDRAEVVAMITEVAQLAFEHAQLYEGLIHHSTHDPLTDLPNRRLCEERLRCALNQAKIDGSRVAVVYIDVNRFKHVNDSFGHKVGDLYLRLISARLHERLRPIDTLARIGGDEFLAIAPQIPGAENAQHLLERLQSCFDQAFAFEGRQYVGSASFGLACFPEHGTTAEELKRFADHAMYLRKRSSANLPSFADRADVNIVTPDEIEASLARGDFRLAYQPQFTPEGRLIGLEALLRLQDPVLGILGPDAFIAVAERSLVIAPLGHWVLRTAIEDAMRWGLHQGPLVLLVVNVALPQIVEPHFATSVASLLEQTNFPPERLELEITERAIVAESVEVLQQLGQLRALGVRISLDDFGTGHSSLSALHRLPVDTIKIDRAFVSALDTEPTVLPVIRAITDMAQCLNKRIVAEGIETPASIPVLLRLGSIDFQGFLFSRPILASQIKEHLDLWRGGFNMPAAIASVPLADTPSIQRPQH